MSELGGLLARTVRGAGGASFGLRPGHYVVGGVWKRLSVQHGLSCLTVWYAAPCLAHEGHTHVMGIVVAISDAGLVVQTQDGKTVTVWLTHNTQYRRAGTVSSQHAVRVGDRVVIEVSEQADALRAVEVRYASALANTR